MKTGDVVAQVFVDGQFRGFSPVTLSNLTPAEHFVTAIAPGYMLAQGKVRGEASAHASSLSPMPGAPEALGERARRRPRGLDRDAALRELGTLAGTEQVLALLVRGAPGAAAQDAIAVRVDVTDGHNLAYATAPMPLTAETMEAALKAHVAGVLQADAPRGRMQAGTPAAIQGGSGKTAGYVLLGTGVALVAGGVLFGLQASSKADEFKKTAHSVAAAEQGALRWQDVRAHRGRGADCRARLRGRGRMAGLPGGGGGGGKDSGERDEARSEARGEAGAGRRASARGKACCGACCCPGLRLLRHLLLSRHPPRRLHLLLLRPSRGRRAAAARAEEERRAGRKRSASSARRKRRSAPRRSASSARRKRRSAPTRRRRSAPSRKRKREEEEKKKREEEEKKKKPALDDDDLRYY